VRILRILLVPIFAGTLLAESHSVPTHPCAADSQQCWQRVTAHINGVFSPRGYFNLLVGLYSLPTLHRAQFNLGAATIVMDFPPGSPTITAGMIHTIERRAGYRPGPISTQEIAQKSIAETGAGWTTIKHPLAKNSFIRWAQQNF
jgi:hypothetical protein